MHDDKKAVRQQTIAVCKLLSLKQKQDKELKVLEHLMPLILPSKSIAIYNAYAWELSLHHVIDFCLNLNKDLYQPLAYREIKQMGLVRYGYAPPEVFSPPEYRASEAMKWYNLDLILVPLVAVDQNGGRLGKGGGYYDTTLANRTKIPPIICGVGFNCQQLTKDLPLDVWDIKLDYFVSERGLTKF